MKDKSLTNEQLAEGSAYSPEEVAFMRQQCTYREKRLIDHLDSYYKAHPINEDEQNFTPQLYVDGRCVTYVQFRPGDLPQNIVQSNVRKLF